MPLFQIVKGRVQQIRKTAFPSEKALQELFENNLETLLRVRFVASEFSTGEKHGGRIDTLGLDENDRPTIIEFKWRDDENIIIKVYSTLIGSLTTRATMKLPRRKNLAKASN